MLVYLLCVRGIGDTQCGFKLMTRSAAITLYQALHINRWSAMCARVCACVSVRVHAPPVFEVCFPLRAFDVELLYIAQQLGMPIKEVAVNWQEIEGVPIILIKKGLWMCLTKALYSPRTTQADSFIACRV